MNITVKEATATLLAVEEALTKHISAEIEDLQSVTGLRVSGISIQLTTDGVMCLTNADSKAPNGAPATSCGSSSASSLPASAEAESQALVCVTPLMLRAGIDVFMAYESGGMLPSEMVRNVFVAMLSVSESDN